MARDVAISMDPSSRDSGSCFDAVGRYILQDFQRKKPFSSFLPGIAGLHGIPMWVFYVNRGQAICSFGVESKDHPILEFQPANRAYQSTSVLGFRTFLNGKIGNRSWYQEVFNPWQAGDLQRTMFIGMNEVEIQEVNPGLGYEANVLYFMLPNEPFSGLVRKVTIKNIGADDLTVEVLDGLPNVIPYGVDNGALKHIGRLIEAWMMVENVEERLPYYHLKATPGDTSEVSSIQSGNYAFTFSDDHLLSVAADPAAVFGLDSGLSHANVFRDGGLAKVFDCSQTLEGRTPAALFGESFTLASGEIHTLTGIYGFASSLELIERNGFRLASGGYIDQKLSEARALTAHLTENIHTESASPVFDAYCRQTFLDNLIRGGYPLMLGGRNTCHVYSRKHGDIERDYNHFVIAPEYYSQGNGNYRDINQNRRNDVYFVPQAGLSNIQLFMSLIQADGYNPLVIKGVTFSIHDKERLKIIDMVGKDSPLATVLDKRFKPGEILETVEASNATLPVEKLMDRVFASAEVHIEAEHGEGYWIDHWTYNLDLIEAYLGIYPDMKRQLLFESAPLPFYDNAHIVQPCAKRFVLSEGKPRQLNAVIEDQEKVRLIQSRTDEPHWVRSAHGHGETFKLPLISKLVLLSLVKFHTLDPEGMGIMMEAGRPGWNDSLNGLPGLFGSSLPETCELLRLVNFLIESLEGSAQLVELPVEAAILIDRIIEIHPQDFGTFAAWERTTACLEAYRQAVRTGFDGVVKNVEIMKSLVLVRGLLEKGIHKARHLAQSVAPTYFIHRVTDYELTGGLDPAGKPYLRVKDFEVEAIPPFLEGAVRGMMISSRKDIQVLHKKLRNSDLFDHKLGLFKVNAPLTSQSHEIGRIRAFTPGWLENESIWMHMAFKYLLELQKAGLYEDFFRELRNHLPAFMDSEVYGRSPLENSSFIVSSAHPDKSIHGTGFVARLSGSTAEFLSMWVNMTAGRQPFRVENKELVLELKPKLPGWLFKENGTFRFNFLGSCTVTLHNPGKLNTYEANVKIKRITLRFESDSWEFSNGVIPSPYAGQIRNGDSCSMEIYF